MFRLNWAWSILASPFPSLPSDVISGAAAKIKFSQNTLKITDPHFSLKISDEILLLFLGNCCPNLLTLALSGALQKRKKKIIIILMPGSYIRVHKLNMCKWTPNIVTLNSFSSNLGVYYIHVILYM